MVTILKKGIEISHHKDGTKTYRPFIDAIWFEKKVRLTPRSYDSGIGYFFAPDGYADFKSEKDSILVLETGVNKIERENKREEDKKVIKKEEKLL